MAPDNGSDSVRSVARAFSLLALFGEEHPTRSLNELVEAAELPKTTVLRLIQTMGQLGFLYTRADGRYCLGPALIRLSRAVDLVWRILQAEDNADTRALFVVCVRSLRAVPTRLQASCPSRETVRVQAASASGGTRPTIM